MKPNCITVIVALSLLVWVCNKGNAWVPPNQPPTPCIEIEDEDETLVNESVDIFEACGDPDGEIVEFKWDFGDGGGYVEGNCCMSHAYSSVGVYAIKLWVRDDCGATGETTRNIVVVTDTVKPSPNPMEWWTEPYATGSASIRMVAGTASDNSGYVEYFFECTAGGGHSSGWQISPQYEDTGLSWLTTYSYRVKVRDLSDNITDWSQIRSATTLLDDPNYTYILTVGMDANDPNFRSGINYDTLQGAITEMRTKQLSRNA